MRRASILASLAGAFVTVAIVYVLTHLLPLRLRPAVTPGIGFTLPVGMFPRGWGDHSSFPSDHAGMCWSLAAGLFFASRAAGIAAACYVTALICLRRVYLGLHWPTHVAAGAFIGVAVAVVLDRPAVRDRLARRPLEWLASSPETFYPCIILLAFGMASRFNDLRVLGHPDGRGRGSLERRSAARRACPRAGTPPSLASVDPPDTPRHRHFPGAAARACRIARSEERGAPSHLSPNQGRPFPEDPWSTRSVIGRSNLRGMTQ